MFKKLKLKKIQKQYKKILSKYNKFFYEQANCVNYFFTYLRYLRDIGIATTSTKDMINDIYLSTLVFAVSEYDNFTSCISKYYDTSNNKAIKKDKNLSDEEVLEKYNIEYNNHLNACITAVINNINEWVSRYGGKI